MSKATNTRIRQYIHEKALHSGSALPPAEELATALSVDVGTIESELAAAEATGIVKRDNKDRLRVAPLPSHDDTEAFSFTATALAFGEALQTAVLENSVRQPYKFDEIEPHPLWEIEQRAHQALGLAVDEPFLVIERMRILHDTPRVIHRSYLDPKRFPDTFMQNHDFAKESLVHVYGQNYHLVSRDTVLQARNPNIYEVNTFRQIQQDINSRLALEHSRPVLDHSRPVLDAEQRLNAQKDLDGDIFVLEYLHALYIDWKYEIKNRPAPEVKKA